MSIDSQKQAQSNDFAEKRAAESRAKQALVYRAVMTTAEAWVTARNTEISCKTGAGSAETCSTPPPIRVANQAFRDAVFDVYIYGTDEANAAALKIAAAIPGTWPGAGPLDVDVAAGYTVFNGPYGTAAAEFQKLMCHDLPALPKPTC